MKLTKADKATISIELNKYGFTVWCSEKAKSRGKTITSHHWLLDGSMVKEDCEIRLGNPLYWKLGATCDKSGRRILLTRTK